MKYIFMITLLIIGCARDPHDGANGTPGTSCKAEPISIGVEIKCSDGSSTIVLNGTNGNNGSDGKDGIDSTPITIVQFCSGQTSHPNKFIEIGFCINNELYAVYSENNGFLVQVPPGNYSSHGHNSSCSFVVQPNCVVSH